MHAEGLQPAEVIGHSLENVQRIRVDGASPLSYYLALGSHPERRHRYHDRENSKTRDGPDPGLTSNAPRIQAQHRCLLCPVSSVRGATAAKPRDSLSASHEPCHQFKEARGVL